jgi:hypothetical protein
LDKLRALDSQTVAELEQVDIALQALLSSSDGHVTGNREFMGMTVLESAEVCLKRAGKPISILELTKTMLAGGVSLKKGKRSPEWKVAQSLSYHQSKDRLAIEDGMVSLPGWKK